LLKISALEYDPVPQSDFLDASRENVGKFDIDEEGA